MTASRLLAVAALATAIAVQASAAEISKEEIQKTLQANPDLVLDVLRHNHKDLLDILNQAVQEERSQQAKNEQADQEKEIADALKHPIVASIDSKTHILGKKSAKYTLLEYADFQCPYCGRAFLTVEELRKKYGDNLRFVFKNNPLPMHPEAMPAAKWFEAVAMQSPEKGWLFYDKMFENQDKLGDEFFKQTTKELGLDVAKTQKDAKSTAVADKIAGDIAEAMKFGFNGTPGFLLNGVPVRGAYPIDTFESIIKRLDAEQAKN